MIFKINLFNGIYNNKKRGCSIYTQKSSYCRNGYDTFLLYKINNSERFAIKNSKRIMYYINKKGLEIIGF